MVKEKIKYGCFTGREAMFDNKSEAISRAKLIKGYVAVVESDERFYVETTFPLVRDFERIVYKRLERRNNI